MPPRDRQELSLKLSLRVPQMGFQSQTAPNLNEWKNC